MRTDPVATPRTRKGADTQHRVTFTRVIRSEWIKLRTQPAPQMLLLLAAAAAIVMSVSNAAGQRTTKGYTDDLLPQLAEMVIMNSVRTAMVFITIPVAAAAVLFATAEFSQRLAPLTFLAVPRRYPVFLARTMLISLTTFAMGAVALITSCVVVSPIIAAAGHELRFWSPTVAFPLLGTILVLGLHAALACCVGTLCRSTIGGIVMTIAIVEIAPSAFTMLASEFGLNLFEHIAWALPSATTLGAVHTYPIAELPPIGPPLGVGLTVFAAWLAVTGAFACLRIQRDV
jgi:ABC-2 type transport system permease protein